MANAAKTKIPTKAIELSGAERDPPPDELFLPSFSPQLPALSFLTQPSPWML